MAGTPSADSPPVAGVRVLSMAEQLPGPYATLLLADLGADVILVERPGVGDPARRDPSFFNALARNKRSVAIDLKSPEGRAQFEPLLASADVLVEGFRPGVMAKLGLDYPQLAQRLPRLIYLSISGYGQDGPYRDRLGHDLSFQAISGLLHAQGASAANPPTIPFADISSAMFAAFAISTALFARERSGHGAYIDVAMADSLMSWMTPLLAPHMNGGRPINPSLWPAYGTFTTAEGKLLALSIAHEDHFWRDLCALLDLHDIADLPLRQRSARSAELRSRIAARIAEHDLEHWEALFDRHGVCWSPVHALDAVAADRHFDARGMIARLQAGLRDERHIPQPLKFGAHRTVIGRAAPMLGQHDDELLGVARPHALPSTG